MAEFVHLHVHTEYSLLDGACRIGELVNKAASMGMKALAITDHGVMYGVVDFYEACKAAGIKPIIGAEVYLAPGSRFSREPGTDNRYYHLILLCKTEQGYHNLIKIVSAGFTDGYYYKPRADKELLRQYSEGLICCSACLRGEVPQKILAEDYEGAKAAALSYLEIFGEGNYYLELQQNGLPEQRLVNNGLVKLSRETGIPLIATNDVHFIEPEDARTQDVLMCIQTGRKLQDEDRMHMNPDAYLRSPEEMAELFKAVPEALENTVKIADKCGFEMKFGRPVLPVFEIPAGFTPETYLRKLCRDGLKERFPAGITEEIRARLEYELDVISRMGYCEYYLIVWDFIKYAKDHGIMVGPGRGSGAASLAAYALKITNIDPLKYNLAFERFLNPERISMPDFDVDFSDEQRKDVIDYVIRKYGADRVAQIVTFGTLAAKMAVRDVGRVMDLPYAKVDSVAKLIPPVIAHAGISDSLEKSPELRELYDSDPQIHELLDTARKLEGMPRNCSTHAAGVVLTRDPVTDYVPVHKNGDSVATQFPMTTLEKIGLLKIDFLGLRTLTVIQDALAMVRENHGKVIDPDEIPTDDPKVYETIARGDTVGVFQLESKGMTRFMTELKPDRLEDIIAGIALYRPGPMDQIPEYIENKKHPEKIKYAHPALKPILDVTYGCMVYQEQVMQIVRDLAGYTMGASDLVRRAMAKKKHDVMAKEREHFIKGAMEHGATAQVAEGIFDRMTDFASYAFNKAHAACYAVVAYQTAWLKTYYPAEFMAGMMNSFINRPERIAVYIHQCREQHIKICPPDINRSGERFTVHDGEIVYALGAIKNVGLGAVAELTEIREGGGPFKSFYDFCERTAAANINKRCVESFVRAGCFDSLGYTRRELIYVFEEIMDNAAMQLKSRAQGQLSLFDDAPSANAESFQRLSEFDPAELLTMEKAVLGVYLTGHPMEKYFQQTNRLCNLTSADLTAVDSGDDPGLRDAGSVLRDGAEVTMAGIITNLKKKTTRSGSVMEFMIVEDLYGSFETILFPKVYEKYGKVLENDMIVIIKGRLNVPEDDAPGVYAFSVTPIDSFITGNDTGAARNGGNEFFIVPELLPRVEAFCRFFEGQGSKQTEVKFFGLDKDGHRTDLPLYSARIMFSREIRAELEAVCGAGASSAAGASGAAGVPAGGQVTGQ